MATQAYKTGASEEYIIIGNDAIMKCNIPSFVTDFVSIVNWEDSEGGLFFKNNNFGNLNFRVQTGKHSQLTLMLGLLCCLQYFAITLCRLDRYWEQINHLLSILVVSQQYKTDANQEYVIIGNDALVKCTFPSFVADFVSIVSWEDSEGGLFHADNKHGNLTTAAVN